MGVLLRVGLISGADVIFRLRRKQLLLKQVSFKQGLPEQVSYSQHNNQLSQQKIRTLSNGSTQQHIYSMTEWMNTHLGAYPEQNIVNISKADRTNTMDLPIKDGASTSVRHEKVKLNSKPIFL